MFKRYIKKNLSIKIAIIIVCILIAIGIIFMFVRGINKTKTFNSSLVELEATLEEGEFLDEATGLTYKVRESNSGECKVTGYMGEDTLALSIPATINGLKVTGLESGAFDATNLDSVVAYLKLPHSIREISAHALSGVLNIMFFAEVSKDDLYISEEAFVPVDTEQMLSSIHVYCLENGGVEADLEVCRDNSREVGIYLCKKENNLITNIDPIYNIAGDEVVIDAGQIVYSHVLSGYDSIKTYSFENNDVIWIGPSAFADNGAVQTIDLSGESNLNFIYPNAFYNCTNLETVKLPDNVNEVGFEISDKAFYGCSKIKEIVLPENTARIGANAFDGMTGTVYYPSSIKSVIENYEGTFSNFVEIKLDSISITKQPNKTEYNYGDSFDSLGIQVMANYSNGTSENITNSCTFSPTSFDKIGKQTITVTYEGKTTTLEVIVKRKDSEVVQGDWIFEKRETGDWKVIGYLGQESNIKIPSYKEGEELPVTRINNYAFGTDPKYGSYLSEGLTIKSLEIPHTVTWISVGAFDKCTEITELILPDNIERIEDNVFDSLKEGTVKYKLGTTTAQTLESYVGEKNRLSVIVPKALEITTSPKTEYKVGEDLDLSGGVLTAAYPAVYATNNQETFIAILNMNSSGIEVTGYDKTKVGNQTITVKYAGATTTFNVTVKKELSSIAITKEPNKTEYIDGESFDPTGMEVTATYSDGSTAPVTNYTIVGGDNLTVGTTSITISYTEDGATKEVTQAITVKVKETDPPIALVEIKLTKLPDKTNYIVGDAFDKTGIVVEAIYTDDTSKNITDECTFSPTVLETVGEQTITVTYQGTVITTFNVTVSNKELSSIAITTPPIKTVWFEQDVINYTCYYGMIVKAIYSDGTSREVTDYEIVNGTNLAVGTTNVTISYTEDGVTKTATQPMTVLAETEGENILKEDSEYKIVGYSMIAGVKPKTTIKEFKNQINERYQIAGLYEVKDDVMYKVEDENEYVKTDMLIEIREINGFTGFRGGLVVTGDCNGTGTTNVADVTTLMMSIAEELAENKDESKILKGAYKKAVDLNENDEINSADLTQLLMFIAENK